MTELMANTAEGPLDRMRFAESQAAFYDEMFLTGDYDHEEFDAITGAVHALDMLTSIPGMKVAIKGDLLTPVVDQDSDFVGHESSRMKEPIIGVYRGFNTAICRVTIDDMVFLQPRVVHMVELEKETYRDAQFTQHELRPTSYILVRGASLEPREARGAHSLRELVDDDVAQDIDEIVFGEELLKTKINLLKDLILPPTPYDDLSIHTLRQRVSYLNSLNLLDDCEVLTDFVISGLGTYPQRCTLVLPAQGSFVVDDFIGFEVTNDCEVADGKANIKDIFNLHLRGYLPKLDNGAEVIIPVHDELEIESIEFA